MYYSLLTIHFSLLTFFYNYIILLLKIILIAFLSEKMYSILYTVVFSHVILLFGYFPYNKFNQVFNELQNNKELYYCGASLKDLG